VVASNSARHDHHGARRRITGVSWTAGHLTTEGDGAVRASPVAVRLLRESTRAVDSAHHLPLLPRLPPLLSSRCFSCGGSRRGGSCRGAGRRDVPCAAGPAAWAAADRRRSLAAGQLGCCLGGRNRLARRLIDGLRVGPSLSTTTLATLIGVRLARRLRRGASHCSRVDGRVHDRTDDGPHRRSEIAADGQRLARPPRLPTRNR
jgi:hypothetical protein